MSKHLYSTTVALPAPFIANSCDPVDSRFVVDNISDLKASTFGTIASTYCKIYPGLQVYVIEDQSVYMYIGPANNNGVLILEADKTDNWIKIADAEGLAPKVLITEVTNGLLNTELAKYILQDSKGNALGDPIIIPKDSALIYVGLGTANSTWNNGHLNIGSGEPALVFVYTLADGTESIVKIETSLFFTTLVAGSGISLGSNGSLDITKDTTLDDSKYLIINNDSIGLSGITKEIDNKVETALTWSDYE